MIQVYDFFDTASQDLYYSLKASGIKTPALVFNDDGFLPAGVTSPYSYFCQMEEGQGKPLYFNQVEIPLYWEITGTNSSGEIWSYDECKAKIFYAEPKQLRLVKNVDWYDKHQKVRLTEHYNRFGWLFARTHFSQDEEIAMKTYLNKEGKEIIIENALTGDVILNWQGKVHFFENRRAFFAFYVKIRSLDSSKMIYNSLSNPFFYSYYHEDKGNDILFWQEDIGEELPGNMQVLLDNPQARTQTILVQNKAVYEKILGMVNDKDKPKFSYLGYIYPIKRQNLGRKSIFIFTNSDQIEQLDYLVQALPDYQFHIAAITEMSPRLLAFDSWENVQLYPNISSKLLEDLYGQCDIYLDVNWGDEVMAAVRQAFEQSMLILGFKQTAHRPHLLLKEHLFDKDNPEDLVNCLIGYGDRLQSAVEQQTKAFNAAPEAYQSLILD